MTEWFYTAVEDPVDSANPGNWETVINLDRNIPVGTDPTWYRIAYTLEMNFKSGNRNKKVAMRSRLNGVSINNMNFTAADVFTDDSDRIIFHSFIHKEMGPGDHNFALQFRVEDSGIVVTVRKARVESKKY